MKIKLDENVPQELAALLRAGGHDVDTVPEEGLTGLDDVTVWEAAQASARFFVTQDLDFSDIRVFAPGNHHGLLLVRLTAPARRTLIARIASVFEHEDVDSWARGFERADPCSWLSCRS